MEKHIEQKKKSAMISLLFGGIVEVMFILKTFLEIGRMLDFPSGFILIFIVLLGGISLMAAGLLGLFLLLDWKATGNYKEVTDLQELKRKVKSSVVYEMVICLISCGMVLFVKPLLLLIAVPVFIFVVIYNATVVGKIE